MFWRPFPGLLYVEANNFALLHPSSLKFFLLCQPWATGKHQNICQANKDMKRCITSLVMKNVKKIRLLLQSFFFPIYLNRVYLNSPTCPPTERRTEGGRRKENEQAVCTAGHSVLPWASSMSWLSPVDFHQPDMQRFFLNKQNLMLSKVWGNDYSFKIPEESTKWMQLFWKAYKVRCV